MLANGDLISNMLPGLFSKTTNAFFQDHNQTQSICRMLVKVGQICLPHHRGLCLVLQSKMELVLTF